MYSYVHRVAFRAGSYSGYNWRRNELALLSSGMSAKMCGVLERMFRSMSLSISVTPKVIGSVACKVIVKFSERHLKTRGLEAYFSLHLAALMTE